MVFSFQIAGKSKSVIFFKSQKLLFFSEKKISNFIQHKICGLFPLPKTPFFLMQKTSAYKYTQYGTSFHFKNANLQYFAILLHNNV